MMAIRKVTDMGWGEEDALWFYTVLPEPFLSNELARLSFAASYDDTDVVSFQPCANPEFANQDRYVIRNLALPGGFWRLRAIFDGWCNFRHSTVKSRLTDLCELVGHSGHETADYAAYALPGIIHKKLAHILEHDKEPAPSVISDALQQVVSEFDNNLGDALLELFPDKLALLDMADDDVKNIINDEGRNSSIVLRCMRGATALISI